MDYGVAQNADALDFHFHRVSGLHASRVARRARIDHIAARESHIAADEADHRRHIEDQIAGALLLYNLAIQARGQQKIRNNRGP